MEKIGNTRLLQADFWVAQGRRIGEKPDHRWRQVMIPHDFVIARETLPDGDGSQGFFDCYHDFTYRREFSVEKKDAVYLLQFDGVFRNSEIYVNGIPVGGRPYGYISFVCDITEQVRSGNNLLEVYVDNSRPPADRWYTGAGIYADVRLIETGRVFVKPMEAFVVALPETGGADVRVELPIVNKTGGDVKISARICVCDGTEVVCEAQRELSLAPGENLVSENMRFRNARYWSDETPHLYTLCVELGGEKSFETRFGVRSITLTAREGFVINGRRVKLKGVNLHHSSGCVGSAFLKGVWRQRLQTLRGMGCNAIRTSHNPMPPAFYDLCDEMGFYVFAEAADKWRWEKGYYKDLFDEWGVKDLTDMVRRDRSHPCVFIWSVGNEVEHQGEPAMLETLRALVETVRKNDPTRPVTFAAEPHCGSREVIESSIPDKVARMKAMAECVDVLSCNYQEQWFSAYHAAMPDIPIIATETYHYFTAQGNCFDNMIPVDPWFYTEEAPYVLGQFLWAGIEYLGESGRYPSKGCTAAPVDIAGFRKPQAWYRQSLWTEAPMVYAAVRDDNLPFRYTKAAWSFPPVKDSLSLQKAPGDLFEVYVFSNCQSVRLTYNDKDYGHRRPGDNPNHVISWFLPYSHGELEVVGFNDGEEACRYTLSPSGPPTDLSVWATKSEIEAPNPHDVTEICVQLLDDQGCPTRDEEREIKFYPDERLAIVGVDNGDICGHFPYQANRVVTWQGRCKLLVRGLVPGEAIVRVAFYQGRKKIVKSVALFVQTYGEVP